MRRIGIIGGGQLGRMAIEEARKYLAQVEVLAPEYPSPAAELADAAHVGSIEDFESVVEFGEELGVVSYEIERANADALRELERRGKSVLPSAEVLRIVQDKAAQKRLLGSRRIPTACWVELEAASGSPAAASGPPAAPGSGAPDPEAADAPPEPAAIARAAESLGGFPLVQKLRRGGYDGRGVLVLESAAAAALPGPSLVEERIAVAKELAVVVARAQDGSTAVYPCVEMVFDERANMCDSVLAPARIAPAARAEAEGLALACVRALDEAAASAGAPAGSTAGLFAIELFLDRDGRILVNEIAPRPHNSGHFSIEACASSQFDQYVRILLGLPLGSPELLRPAMMVNLFGEPGQRGEAEYVGLERALAIPGVSVHLYGKREVRPFRKMGHLTALGRTAEEAMDRAEAARGFVRVLAR